MTAIARAAKSALALAFMAVAPGLCQQVEIQRRPKPPTEGPPQPRASIRVDSNLVLIPVTVTDPLNRPVTGLDKEHFRVFEDKIEQDISQFASDDAPLAVGLVFDVSGSMGDKLRKSRQAAAQFFRAANPEDEFFLVEFNERPRLAAPLTSNLEEIQNRLTFSQSKGRTALLDAVYLALHEMKKSRKPRKALLILSDGGDNSSRYTVSEVRTLVRESESLIYAIGIF
jgi:Ca-activated chloride channel homolog